MRHSIELLLVDEVPEGRLGGLVLLLRHDIESLHAGAPGAVPGQTGHRDLPLSHFPLFDQDKQPESQQLLCESVSDRQLFKTGDWDGRRGLYSGHSNTSMHQTLGQRIL